MSLVAHLLALVTMFTSGVPTRAENPQRCYSQTIHIVIGLNGAHDHLIPGKGCEVKHRRRTVGH